MKRFSRIFILTILLQTFLNSCIAGPNSSSSQREIKHMQEYLFKDQSSRNEFHKNQDFDNLEGCPILVDMGKWTYVKSRNKNTDKMFWKRHQSWMYPSGIISESGTAIDDEDFIKPQNSVFIYVGPWKEVNIKKILIFGKTINKKIRFTAIQKKNDRNNGYIYNSYEFMTEKNKNIPEQKITLPKGLPTPDFESFCETKWVAKYGYNAVFDRKSGKIIDVVE